MGVSTISLLLTNDWELYGEGSGNFYEIQSRRLDEILQLLETHQAKLSVFAEVGQQWAHLASSASSEKVSQIAADWEKHVRDVIRRGHDVQLHYHPTWKNAKLSGDNFKLDLSNWALADLGTEVALAELKKGREYLNYLGQGVRADYRCIAFRAGAFCLQPIADTLPLLRNAGLIADSSVLPGAWDYLYFDFRHVPTQLGPFWLDTAGKITRAEPNQMPRKSLTQSVLELPIHTEIVWDSPIIRRLLPASFGVKWHFGVPADPVYEDWSARRDAKLLELSAHIDPLETERRRSKMSLRNWLGYLLRKSSYALDYDFMQPDLFVAIIKAGIARAEKEGFEGNLPLVALGHANNAHTTENLERILIALKKEFGTRLQFSTLQQTIEMFAAKTKSHASHNILHDDLTTKVS